MIIYILKFSACLAIFLAFYKLFLERENMHQFKRFYLVTMLLISAIIPFITFTQYIEVQPIAKDLSLAQLNSNDNFIVETKSLVDYLPTILWSIYGIGVILFGIKFGLNLSNMVNKIRKNPKLKNNNFIHVLLKDFITPHTFFSYIFLNKHKYKTHQIPQEVLLHEQSHAKQKHSIDILFIEILQVLFWFNPLIYFIKRSIKLNHEFLADKAVLNQGVETLNYQQVLLAFSTKDNNIQLANAINYSSIKKRITVMKTHTSKQKIWLRSFILLPLLALTLYSFSERKEVTKEIKVLNNNPTLEINHNPETFRLNGKTTSLSHLRKDFLEATNNKKSELKIITVGGIKMSLIYEIKEELKDNLIKISLAKDAFIIDDTTTNENQQQTIKIQDGASREQMKEYNTIVKKLNEKPERERIIKLKDYNRIKYIYNLMSDKQKKDAEPFPNIPPPPPPPPAPESIDPNLPPPPPPPIPENATKEQKETYKKGIEEYNRKYTIKNGMVSENPPPPPPPIPDNATKEQRKKYEEATRIYNLKADKKAYQEARLAKIKTEKGELTQVRALTKVEVERLKKEKLAYKNRQKLELAQVREARSADVEQLKKEKLAYQEARNQKLKTEKIELAKVRELRKKEDVLRLKQDKLAYAEAQRAKLSTEQRLAAVKEIQTPEPPKSPLDHVVDMAKKGAIFYLEGKQVSSDDAIAALKKNKSLNIETKSVNSKQPKVYITKKPIVIDN